jgi:hypothetical protein
MIEGLSGPFANTGEAVIRNLAWALERVNQRGGVRVGGVMRPMALERYDSKGQAEEALSALRAAIDDGARIVVQGNSSAVAAALTAEPEEAPAAGAHAEAATRGEDAPAAPQTGGAHGARGRGGRSAGGVDEGGPDSALERKSRRDLHRTLHLSAPRSPRPPTLQ